MDQFKLARLAETDPSVVVHHLTDLEATRLRTRLVEKFGLFDAEPTVSLLNSLKATSTALHVPRADEEGFDLVGALRAHGIEPQERIYINWYRFDNLDDVRFDQFNAYFDDFWYPGPDDIDIFDDTLEWIATIDYLGVFWIAKPPVSE